MAFASIDELLAFAIDKEESAARFYLDLASRMDRPAMRQVFLDFAREEEGHQARLQAARQQGHIAPAAGRVPDLKMANYLVEQEPYPGMEYAEALVLAMRMEKAAFQLYSDLALSVGDPALRDTLNALAQEEARHKLRFEVEYDEFAQRDN